MVSVSFQGERGAYSQAAALGFFDHDNNKNIQTIPLPTFADVLQCVVDQKADYAIIPVENSIEGSVGESYDLLYNTNLKVIGETYHKIQHCLISSNPQINEIDTVYSHPQALGQCRKFIQQHNMKTIPTYDTAGSVKIIKDINKKSVACIASAQASQIHKLPVIQDNIADNANNYTRFLILSSSSKEGQVSDTTNATAATTRTTNDGDNNNKTSIIFSVKHQKDALYRIMEKFHQYKINLTKIESRPTKTTAWEYNFYVDFETMLENHDKTQQMLDEIKDQTLSFKKLGTYKAAHLD